MRIVQLVGERYPQNVWGSVAEMLQVLLLPLEPWWLWCCLSIRAAVHDANDAIAEPEPDFLARFGPTLVLNRIMQQSGNRLG